MSNDGRNVVAVTSMQEIWLWDSRTADGVSKQSPSTDGEWSLLPAHSFPSTFHPSELQQQLPRSLRYFVKFYDNVTNGRCCHITSATTALLHVTPTEFNTYAQRPRSDSDDIDLSMATSVLIADQNDPNMDSNDAGEAPTSPPSLIESATETILNNFFSNSRFKAQRVHKNYGSQQRILNRNTTKSEHEEHSEDYDIDSSAANTDPTEYEISSDTATHDAYQNLAEETTNSAPQASTTLAKCIVITDHHISLSCRRRMHSPSMKLQPIRDPNFPIGDYFPFEMASDLSFTILKDVPENTVDANSATNETSTTTNFSETQEILISWDQEGSICAIFYNSLEAPFDSRLLFYAPGVPRSHLVFYGRRSFAELADQKRVPLNARETAKFQVSSIEWTCDGLFLLLLDGRGNISMVSRLGDFVWLLRDETCSPTRFLTNVLDTLHPRSDSIYNIAMHPTTSLVSFSNGFVYSTYKLPSLKLANVVSSFIHKDIVTGFQPYKTSGADVVTMINVWRMALSHPQFVNEMAASPVMDSLISKLAMLISATSDFNTLSALHRTALECIHWSVCHHNTAMLAACMLRLVCAIVQNLMTESTNIISTANDIINASLQLLQDSEADTRSVLALAYRNIVKNVQIPLPYVRLFSQWVSVGLFTINQGQQLHGNSNTDDSMLDTMPPTSLLSNITKNVIIDEPFQLGTNETALKTVVNSTERVEEDKWRRTLRQAREAYMCGKLDECVQHYTALGSQPQCNALSALFAAHLLRYDIHAVLDLLHQQITLSTDSAEAVTAQLNVEEVEDDNEPSEDAPNHRAMRDSSRLRKGSAPALSPSQTDLKLYRVCGDPTIVRSMAILLTLAYRNQQAWVLPPILCDNNVGRILSVVHPVPETATRGTSASAQPPTSPSKLTNGLYYLPLEMDKLRATMNNTHSLQSQPRTGKHLAIELWIALGNWSEAVAVCMEHSLWNVSARVFKHLRLQLKQQQQQTDAQSSRASLPPDNAILSNITSVLETYLRVLQYADQPQHVNHVLLISELSVLFNTTQLRKQAARRYLRQIQLSLSKMPVLSLLHAAAPPLVSFAQARTASPRASHIHQAAKDSPKRPSFKDSIREILASQSAPLSPHKRTDRKIDIVEEANLRINALQAQWRSLKSREWHQTTHVTFSSGTDENEEQWHNQLNHLFWCCFSLFRRFPKLLDHYASLFGPHASNSASTTARVGTKVPTGSGGGSSSNTDDVCVNEFRLLCRYLWFSHVRDMIEANLSRCSLTTRYSPTMYRVHKIVGPKVESVTKSDHLLQAANWSVFLLDFDDLFGRNVLQDVMLTLFSRLPTSQEVVNLMLRYLPLSKIADVNMSKYNRLMARIRRDNSNLAGQLEATEPQDNEKEADAELSSVDGANSSEKQQNSEDSADSLVLNEKMDSTFGWSFESNPAYWQLLKQIFVENMFTEETNLKTELSSKRNPSATFRSAAMAVIATKAIRPQVEPVPSPLDRKESLKSKLSALYLRADSFASKSPPKSDLPVRDFVVGRSFRQEDAAPRLEISRTVVPVGPSENSSLSVEPNLQGEIGKPVIRK